MAKSGRAIVEADIERGFPGTDGKEPEPVIGLTRMYSVALVASVASGHLLDSVNGGPMPAAYKPCPAYFQQQAR